MNNFFKKNDRFDYLIDNSLQKQNNYTNNTMNTVNHRTKDRNRYSDYEQKYTNTTQIKEQALLKKIQNDLDINNFPDLICKSNNNHHEKSNNINFVDKVKTTKTNDIKKNELSDLPPGWILIKKDPITFKTVFLCNEKNCAKNQKQDKIDLNPLIKLHEKRTKDYINLYGYDTWEKMFKSPNWIEEQEYYDNNDDDYDMEDELYELLDEQNII